MLTALAELGLEPFRGLLRAPPGRGRARRARRTPEIRIRGQKVPAVNPGSPNRSANVGRLEQTLVDDELGFVDNGDRGVCSLSICEIAGLGQNQYPVDGDVDSRRVLAIEVEFPDGKDETVINQIPLIQEGIRSR